MAKQEFKCEVCNRTFTKERGLQVHSYQHQKGKTKRGRKQKHVKIPKGMRVLRIPLVVEIPLMVGGVNFRLIQE